MNRRTRRLPTGLLIIVAILGAMLVVTDIDQVVEAGNWAPLRSDLRAGLTIVACGALVWIALNSVLDALGRAGDGDQDTIQPRQFRVVGNLATKSDPEVPENVRAFEIGRRVGRKEGSD